MKNKYNVLRIAAWAALVIGVLVYVIVGAMTPVVRTVLIICCVISFVIFVISSKYRVDDGNNKRK